MDLNTRYLTRRIMKIINIVFLYIVLIGFQYGFTQESFHLHSQYRSAKPGDWVLIESNQGGRSLTLIVSKTEEFLWMDIESIQNGKSVSVSRQKLSLSENKITEAYVKQDGRLYVIHEPSSDFEQFLNLDLKKDGEEEIITGKGKLLCQKYRGIYNDYLIQFWLNNDIPLLGVAKISAKGLKIQALDWGSTGIEPFYEEKTRSAKPYQ